ncbi:ABC transporter permease [Candidatus Woesearchaeota archaeon]|nr:ABC transporter permease [Candidatus Woesearchaeota archaeon]
MNLLWLLTKKNLTLLMRAKTSALVVIFGPLLLMLVLGVSYNSSDPYRFTIGVHTSGSGEDLQKFMDGLQEEGFTVVKYNQSIEQCVQQMKLNAVHTCLNLPENFAVEGNTQKEITFYLDPSRIHLVAPIQNTLQKKFNVQVQQTSQQISQDLLSRLSTTKITLSEKKGLLDLAKEKNTLAATAAGTAQSSLSGLDVSVPENTYDTSAVTILQNELAGAQEKLSEASDLLEGANVSGASKSEILSLLTGAGGSLTSATISVTGEANASGTGIASVISGLESDLQITKSKLTTAAAAVVGSTEQLSSTTHALQESVSALDGMATAINDVQANLDAQKVTDPATVAAPLVAKIEEVAPQNTHLSYLFPILLVVVVMFTSLLLGTTLVMMEKNSPAFLRNYFVPVKKITFITSTYLTTLIVLLVQIGVILSISLLFMKETLPMVPALFGLLFISGSVFTFLGMGLGYLFTSEETGVLASVSAGSLLLFVSGVVLPVESISPTLREIMSFNPFVLAEKLIRQAMVFKTSFADMGVDLVLLAGYAFIFLLAILIAESLLHQHLAHRFMKNRHKIHRQTEKREKSGM